MTSRRFRSRYQEPSKLSTRKGNIILLEPTLQEAISRAKLKIEDKNPELETKKWLLMLSWGRY